MKKAIVTGAAGFVGYHLTKTLSDNGYYVYAIIRPGSKHNNRIKGMSNVKCIEIDIESDGIVNIDSIAQLDGIIDLFFHLTWKSAERYDYQSQIQSAYLTFRMLELSSYLRCKRFVGIGSQAEYGSVLDTIEEDVTQLKPFCGYGVAKLTACEFTRRRAKELNIEWVWGRIFSVYGKYEPSNRLLPYIIEMFLKNEDVKLSSCEQNWDFLYGTDAGEALLAMAERGHNGEIYNIADGRYRQLKEFVEEIQEITCSDSKVTYGCNPNPFVSLQPSVEKLKKDTDWEPKVSFGDGIRELMKE